jgi:hypothetical protein
VSQTALGKLSDKLSNAAFVMFQADGPSDEDFAGPCAMELEQRGR